MIDKRLTDQVRWKTLLGGVGSLLLGSLSAANAASVTLAWDAESGVAGYRLHYGTSSGSYAQTGDVGTNTTATVSNLTAGQTYYFAVTAYNSTGLESQPSNEVSFNALQSTLFKAGDIPATVTVNDSNPVELGVKFQTTTAGQITGFRFYKSPQNTGTHVAHLWSAQGTLLASATFTNETASGWQQVNLSSPVTLTAATTYTVSYHTNGFYSANANYFANAHSSGVLTAPPSLTSAGNGVYAYGSTSGIPKNSYNATNYWVDLVFKQF
jgi:Domain of unknown function (DUF4082)/Fibronectin type III domain